MESHVCLLGPLAMFTASELRKVKAPKKSNITQTTWSPEVMWQTKKEIFLSPEEVWPLNVAEC